MTLESSKLRLTLVPVLALMLSLGAHAQQRLIDDVKRDLSSLTLKPKNYTDALNKLKPALTHEATKDKAETWFVASKICFDFYDKSMVEKTLGNNINSKTVGHTLLEGYRYAQQALTLDSVKQTRKDGSVIIDKKSGRPRVKTKYSSKIMGLLLGHLADFSSVGSDLFIEQDWDGAYRAWDIYCDLAKSPQAEPACADVDSVVAYYRYFQGLAASQTGDYHKAMKQFEQARDYGSKNLYDSWLDAALKTNDTVAATQIAQMAYLKFGDGDPKYIRIMINSYLRSGDYDRASLLVDQAIRSDSVRPEYLNLKGRLLERQFGQAEAQPFYQRAVDLDAENAHYRFDLGYCLYQQAEQLGDGYRDKQTALYKQALPHIEKAYNLDPKNNNAKKVLTRLYYLLGSNKIDRIGKSF